MSKLTFVVPAVAVEKNFSTPLTPGEYEGVIKEMRSTTIRNGRHAGKKSIDVAIQMEDGRYIWKVLPQFTAAQVAKLSEADRKWFEMSVVSFAKALGLESGQVDIDELVGKSVKVLVGMHQDNGYGPQNSIVKFVK